MKTESVRLTPAALKKKYGFENPFRPDPLSKKILKHLDGGKRLSPGGRRLLDVGCGEGADSVFFARRGFRVTSVDKNGDWLRRFRAYCRDERPGSITIRRASATSYKYPHDAYDVVISLLVICCMKRSEVARVIPAVKKAVKPGGVIAISARNYLDPEFKDYRRTEKPVEPNTFATKEDCCKFLYFLEKGRLGRLFKGFEILDFYEGPAPCKYGEHPVHGDTWIICRRPLL